MAKQAKFSAKRELILRGVVPRYIFSFGPRMTAYVVISKTRSNHLFTLTDLYGKVVHVLYSGQVGLTGPRKKRSFLAAERLGAKLGEYASDLNVKTVLIVLKVPISAHTFGVARGLVSSGVKLWGLKDSSCVPHNGTRRKKMRRA